MPAPSFLPASSPAAVHGGRRRPVAALAVVVLALAMILGFAGEAGAHDELASSDPAEGATVDVLPPNLELTFSNVPSGIGAQVQVLDASGTDWADGAVGIVDRTATQPLRSGAPAGQYTVNWRVVSSDSHPIEGTFSFTTQQGSTTGPDSATTQGPLDTQEAPDNETQTAGVSDFPWSIVLMIATLLVIVAVLAVMTRKRLRAGR